jgi:hypothetical protein
MTRPKFEADLQANYDREGHYPKYSKHFRKSHHHHKKRTMHPVGALEDSTFKRGFEIAKF